MKGECVADGYGADYCLTHNQCYSTCQRGLGFHRGMLAALAVVAEFDAETIYREIVKTAGIKSLNDALESETDHELSGLKRYGYRLPRRLRARPEGTPS
ncbi:MAG TPA: hypothetical protein VEA38_13845 [Terriglobales bacterium]|nr:hypothetical protein [Terriglobales bacterium]